LFWLSLTIGAFWGWTGSRLPMHVAKVCASRKRLSLANGADLRATAAMFNFR